MTNFQTILTAIFLAFFVFAVLIFSGAIKIGGPDPKDGAQGKVVIWGTFPKLSINNVIEIIRGDNSNLSLDYVQKDKITYQQELIEAFANGKGPDLFVITPDMIKKNDNFIYKIPYTNFPEKSFRDTFIDGADIYIDQEGVIGYPLVVDPMMLYYNKDILSNEGIVVPPKTWDELFTLNPILTKRENNGTVLQSMIALGQYNNINNSKDILVNLLLQNNNPIIKRGSEMTYSVVLNSNPQNLSISPIEAVLQFFLEFSNPSKNSYSWNGSLPNSLDMFTGGKLAFYLGRASELFNIESINPNLSFDITQIPQIKNSTTKRNYGEIYAVVINKKSTNISSAFSIASALSQGDNAKNLAIALSLPPVSRALLKDKPTDPYLFTFFNSAIMSRSWLDPNNIESDLIFKGLINNILSNSLSMNEAISKAQGQLDLLIKK